MYEKEVMYMAGAGAAGVLANWAIKNYVSPTSVLVTLPYNLGTTQNMIGLVGGIGAIALGYYGMKTRKFLPDPRLQMAAMAFGGSLLTTTLINTLGVGFGMPPAARAYPRASVRAVPSGAGYAMMSKQQTNIL
jgi:hypothetical protein